MKLIICLFTCLILLANCSQPVLDINKIEFAAGECFGECSIFNLSITGDGTAMYNAKAFNKTYGQFQTKIKRRNLDSLNLLLSQAHFFELRDDYSTNWTDKPTYRLTLKLKNGRIKRIVDYGPSGPEHLLKVYRYLFSLRDTQDWKMQ